MSDFYKPSAEIMKRIIMSSTNNAGIIRLCQSVQAQLSHDPSALRYTAPYSYSAATQAGLRAEG